MSELMSGGNASKAVQELRERLAFLGLDAKALGALTSIKGILDRGVPEALELFYSRAMATPETRSHFSDPKIVERAKARQVEHWRRLASGELEGHTLEQTRRVGETHARIGLSPKWYAAGYGVIADHLIKKSIVELWPKKLFGGTSAKAEEAGAALSALARVLLLDFELATSAYLDTLDAKRSAAEAVAAEGARDSAAAMDALRGALSKLANKNFDCRIDAQLAAAYTQTSTDFNSAVSTLREALTAVSASGESIRSASREIADGSQNLSSRAEQDAAAIEQSSAALQNVSSQVAATTQHAKAAQVIVGQAGAEAKQGNEIVTNAVSAMGRIEKSTSDIGQIISAIDEIAFQTNLLALNAGVEAARAGEAGRGFAVVAAEVRGLALRSAEAAKQIKTLVVTATTEVAGGVKLVNAAGEALGRIGTKITDLQGVVRDIDMAAMAQSTSLAEIDQAVSSLTQSTQQNASMSEQSTAASQSLAHEAATLGDLIGQFNLERASAPTARRTYRAA